MQLFFVAWHLFLPFVKAWFIVVHYNLMILLTHYNLMSVLDMHKVITHLSDCMMGCNIDKVGLPLYFVIYTVHRIITAVICVLSCVINFILSLTYYVLLVYQYNV